VKKYFALLLGGLYLLSGCGGGQSSPPLTISTASLPNGTSELPYSQTIQASGGVGPFTWAVSAGTLPHNLVLSNSSMNTVTISGTPDTAVQGAAFTIKVMDSANQSAAQPYTVSILLEPDSLTLTPSILDFGVQLVGTASSNQTETLTNTGGSELVISGVAMAGTNVTDFNQSGTCRSSLAAGANCTIGVTFTPSLIGPRSASITITDNSVGSPHSVSLSGVGVNSGPNATLSAASLTFPNESVGTTSPAQSITLSNYGTTPLNVSDITASSSFSETDNCVPSLASAATCTINVTFTPSTTGSISGTLSVTDSAPGSPHSVSLSGTGRTRSSGGGYCEVSLNSNVLTGYCFKAGAGPGGCHVSYDPAGCPAGRQAITPGYIVAACFPPTGPTKVDTSSSCNP